MSQDGGGRERHGQLIVECAIDQHRAAADGEPVCDSIGNRRANAKERKRNIFGLKSPGPTVVVMESCSGNAAGVKPNGPILVDLVYAA